MNLNDFSSELDHNFQNESIYKSVMNSISSQYPVVGKSHTLKLIDLEVDDNLLPSNDLPAQKKTKLENRTWAVPIYGHLQLIDNETGEIVEDKPHVKLAAVPKLTPRYSMIIDGNEYQTINQLRLKSGIYTRIKSNGEFESQFNLQKGFNFRLNLEPLTGIFTLETGTQHYRLYDVLKALNADDNELIKLWGMPLYQKNSKGGVSEMAWSDLVEKLTHKPAKGAEDAKTTLQKYFEDTEVDPKTTKITLGQAFDKATLPALLATSKRLLEVQKGEAAPDERDSLVFKNIYGVDDQISQFMDKKGVNIKHTIANRLDRKMAISEIIGPELYTKPLKRIFTSLSELSSTPPQTNPVSILSEWRKTTITGTGGIQSRHAISMEARDVHPSHLGFLDPINTPTGPKVGINLPLTVGAVKKGLDLYSPLIFKNGTVKQVSPGDQWNLTVGFGDEYTTGKDNKPVAKAKMVSGIKRGISGLYNADEVDAYLITPQQMLGWSANLVPFFNNIQGNRGIMASNMMGQALVLDHADSPLVLSKVSGSDNTYEELVGDYLNPRVPKDIKNGIVTKIDKDYITIKADDGEIHKVGLYNNFPLNQESFLDSIPTVNVGDKIKSDQKLANNNFQKNILGETRPALALGGNVNTAFMNWHGYNHEDGIVVTESFAKKFAHTILDKESVGINKDGFTTRSKFVTFFPDEIQFSKKIDEDGVIKEGNKVHKGDILVAYAEPRELTEEEKILKSIHKSSFNPFVNRALRWEKDEPGEVIYVNRGNKKITVQVKTSFPAQVGDKLSARWGDKGVITKIIKDEEAPHTINGERMDVIVTPAGIPSRMNPGQILEAYAGKIAVKEGKPYYSEIFSGEDHIKKIAEKGIKMNIPAEEILLDGKGGKPFKKPIFWGNKHYLKLMHVIEHKSKERSFGAYGADEQPTNAPEGGGQAIDPLMTYAMLGSGAKHNLYEATALKSQKNDELWRAIQLGQPIPTPKYNFAWDKMTTYLKAAGVDIDKKGSKLQLKPLTDKATLELSSGELPLESAASMLRGKDLSAIKGGLFDVDLTGGLRGTKWSRLRYPDPLPNPMYEGAIQSILGINAPEYERRISGENGGIPQLIKDLKQVDVDGTLAHAKEELKKAKPQEINKYNKKVRYLQALKTFGMTPDQAYITAYLPIMPPKFRPIYPMESGDLRVAPINNNYRNVALIASGLKSYKDIGIDKEFGNQQRKDLYEAVKETQGLMELTHFGKEKYEGLLTTIAGSGPKFGYAQNKAWRKRQDLSARSTITIDPDLGVDEVGLPTPMVKKIFQPFAVQKLVGMGYHPFDAIKHIAEDTPTGLKALDMAMEDRPVLLNRAPTLHRHGVQAFNAKRISGKSIQLNPLILSGFNADLNGDSCDENTIVYLKLGHKNYVTKVGDFVKNILLPNTTDEDLLELAKNGTLILTIQDLEVLGLDLNNQIKYVPVNEVTIHTSHGGCFEVKLSHNLPVVVSEHHNFEVIDLETLDGVKLKTEKLEVGMLVPVCRKLIIKDYKTKIEIKDPTGKEFDSRVKINKKINLDFNSGYFFGIFIGDGSVFGSQEDTISISCIIKEQQGLIKNSWGITFNTEEGHISDYSLYKDGSSIRFYCAPLARWFKQQFGHTAINKQFPDWFLETPEEFRKGLIAGLMDSDGSVTTSNQGKTVVFSFQMISQKALIQLKILLKTLGIQSALSEETRKTKAGNTVYNLRVNSTQLDEFPFHPESIKYNKYQELRENLPKKVLRSTMDMVPYNVNIHKEILDLPQNLRKDLEKREKFQIEFCKKWNIKLDVDVTMRDIEENTSVTRDIALRLIAEKVNIKTVSNYLKKWMDIVLNEEVKYLPIEAIIGVERRKVTYDFSLPPREIFMVNDGTFTRNTMSVYTPATNAGRDEAYSLLPSKMLYVAGEPHGKLPTIESFSQLFLLGIWYLSKPEPSPIVRDLTIGEANNLKKHGQLEMTEEFNLKGVGKTTLGKELIMSVLPMDLRDRSVVFDGKELDKLARKIIEKYPAQYADIISSLKDLGNMWAHDRGATIGFKDINIDRAFRDKIVSDTWKSIKPGSTTKQIATAFIPAMAQVDKEGGELFKNNNNFYDFMKSGAKGNPNNFRQINTMVGVLQDVKGNLLPPITHSWSEGLKSSEYWNHTYATRKGAVDAAVNTQDSGALNKALLANTRKLLITEEDCGTTRGIMEGVNDPSLYGRFAAETVGGVVRYDQLIDGRVASLASNKGLTELKVRSPLTCESIEGICQKCYGLMPDGQIPQIGTNVGIIDGQAVSERSTQLTLKTKHCLSGDSTLFVKNNNLVELQTLRGLINTNFSGEVYDLYGWTKVINTIEHKVSGNIKFIKVKGGNSLIGQDNHPYMICKNEWLCEKCGNTFSGKDKQCKKCNHRNKNITIATKLGTCEERGIESSDVRKSSFVLSGPTFNGYNEVNWDFELSPYLIGSYISEGSIAVNGNYRQFILTQAPNSAIWCAYKELLNSAANEKNVSKSISLREANFIWEQCGRYSISKKLPSKILHYSGKIFFELLAGIIDGDGAIIKSPRIGKHSGNDFVAINTISYALANQLVIVSNYFGLKADISKTTYRPESGFCKNRKEGFVVRIRLNKTQLDVLKEFSIKLKNDNTFKTGNQVIKNDPGTISVIKDFVYEEDTVFDLATESGTLIVNGIWVHNTGGAISDKSGITSGFKELESALKVPSTLPNKATLAERAGTVTRILPAAAGGWEVHVNGAIHIVAPQRELLVKEGDIVYRGQPLSAGTEKPQEVATLRGFLDAQLGMVNRMHNVYDKKFHKRTFETVVRGISNNSEINNQLEDSPWLRGDNVSTTAVEAENKERKTEGLDPITFTPYFKSIDVLPADSEDWLGKLSANRIKDAIVEGAARGHVSNLDSTDPIPGYMFALDFNKRRF